MQRFTVAQNLACRAGVILASFIFTVIEVGERRKFLPRGLTTIKRKKREEGGQ